MLSHKNKYLYHLYIFFLILIFIFNEFSTNIVLGNNFNISNVEVEEVYDLDFEKSKVIDKAFKESFKIMINRIVENNDRSIVKNISLKEIKGLIDNFSIIDERFINKKYISNFDVQFNKRKILNYLNNRNIIPSSPEKIDTFLFRTKLCLRFAST